MTDRDEPEQQQAELLWNYIEQLKQADNPDTVQFVAVTSGRVDPEGAVAEVVGLMETAAEAGAWARSESAPGCRREVARRRLRGAIAASMPAAQTAPAAAASSQAPARAALIPAWLTAPLTARSAGWVVAVAALALGFWMASTRAPTDEISPPPVPPATHEQALNMMPALVAGTLDAVNSLAVWEHMNRCQECLQTYQTQWHAAHPDRPAHQTGLWHVRPLPGYNLAWARGVAQGR